MSTTYCTGTRRPKWSTLSMGSAYRMAGSFAQGRGLWPRRDAFQFGTVEAKALADDARRLLVVGHVVHGRGHDHEVRTHETQQGRRAALGRLV